jgi:acetyl-CoA carboxylase biotin carboxylase subunit
MATSRSDRAGAVPQREIRKVLIANRGEIAVRVARTLREMGIGSVAVYSEADREAVHAFAADEAYLIGPAAAAESYLRADALIATAHRAGADAVHPGYGFLAESADFAERVLEAGLAWIGPTPDAARALGDKVRARAIAIGAGVPVLPGTEGPVSDPAELRRVADSIGYPVVLKAAAGGGGKGMRQVRDAKEFEQAVRLTQGEARNAFGDDRLYLERWLEKPRHIEVQILADGHGTVLALGERECSIQRRHQKLVEETPSAVLDPARRARLWELAVRVAAAGGYTNAGTAEFLLDQGGDFHFLEMNARLQVEHPVTEMVLGLDLVREQVRVARGEPLGYGQDAIRPSGASMEFRISAEDPDGGFLPQAGLVRRLELPAGPGVRCDVGVRSGGQVTVHYDPLIGKIIVWAPTREQCLERARRALAETTIEGIHTTLPFHRWLLEQDAFRTARYDTGWLAHAFAGSHRRDGAREERTAAVLAAVYAHVEAGAPRTGADGAGSGGAGGRSRWRSADTGLRGELRR